MTSPSRRPFISASVLRDRSSNSNVIGGSCSVNARHAAGDEHVGGVAVNVVRAVRIRASSAAGGPSTSWRTTPRPVRSKCSSCDSRCKLMTGGRGLVVLRRKRADRELRPRLAAGEHWRTLRLPLVPLIVEKRDRQIRSVVLELFGAHIGFKHVAEERADRNWRAVNRRRRRRRVRCASCGGWWVAVVIVASWRSAATWGTLDRRAAANRRASRRGSRRALAEVALINADRFRMVRIHRRIVRDDRQEQRQ